MAFKTALVTQTCQALRPFFPQRALPSHPKSIIVIKPCCLGDLVLTTPAIAALKERYPQTQIDMAVGSWSRAALANNPHIRQLIDSGRVGQGPYTLADLWQLAVRLRQTGYDLSVTLARSPLIGLVPWLAGIPHRLGLDSYGRGFMHTARMPVLEAPRHEALIYLDCVSAGGPNPSNECASPFKTDFYPNPAEGDSLPPMHKPFVIIHPSGGTNPGMQLLNKRWPGQNFARLADKLVQQGFHIVLTGIADDQGLCQEIASRMQQQPSPQILAGEISLAQFGHVCQQAALFIGGDTGAMHLAVASGCQTLAIFGPSDPRRYAPFGPPEQVKALWHPFDLPSGGVGQGVATDFSWDTGVTIEEAWAGCQQLLGVNL